MSCFRAVHQFLLRDPHSFCHLPQPHGESGLAEELEHGVVALQSDPGGKSRILGLMADPLQIKAQTVPGADRASLLLHHAERDEDVAASTFSSQLPKGVIRYKADDGRGPDFG